MFAAYIKRSAKENLDQVIKFSEQAIQSGADFILTPENTFFHYG